MPDFTPSSGPDYTPPITVSGAEPTAGVQQAAANSLYPSGPGMGFGTLAGMGLAAVPDFVDSVASSKFLGGAFGVERNQVNNSLYNALGVPAIQNFVAEHQQGIETMSGLGGFVALAAATDGLGDLAEGAGALDAMRATPGVRSVLALGDQYSAALQNVKAADFALASRGAIGSEAYNGAVTVDGWSFDAQANAFMNKQFDTTRSTAVFKAKTLAGTIGFAKAAKTEAIGYAALNSNGFLYSDDMSENMRRMGFGLALGTVGELFNASYKMRQAVNTQGFKRAVASALDPSGFTADSLGGINTAIAESAGKGKGLVALTPDEVFLGGTHTDAHVSLMSQAASLEHTPVTGNDARALLGNRNTLAIQLRTQAQIELQKAVRGIPWTDLPAFNVSKIDEETNDWARTLNTASYRSANALSSVEEIGGLGPDLPSSFDADLQRGQAIRAKIQETQDTLSNPNAKLTVDQTNDMRDLLSRLNHQLTFTPSVFINADKMPLGESALFENFREPKLTFEQDPNAAQGLFGKQVKEGSYVATSPTGAFTSSIDSNGKIKLPGGKSFVDGDAHDVMRGYRAIDNMITDFSNRNVAFTVPQNPTFAQLDLAEKLIQRSSNNPTKVIWPQGMDRNSAQVESYAQKMEAMNVLLTQARVRQLMGGPKAVDPDSLAAEIGMRLNLPALSPYERALTNKAQGPAYRLAQYGQAFGPNNVRAMSFDQLKQSVATFKRIGDTSPTSADDVSDLIGNSITFMKGDDGKIMAPVMVYSRPTNAVDWTQQGQADRLAQHRMYIQQTLTGANADPLTRTLATRLYNSPNLEAATATHTLSDVQIQGSVLGTPTQSTTASVLRAFSTDDWIARDNQTLQAASALHDDGQRVALAESKALVDNAFGGAQDALKNPRNAGSAMLLNQFFSQGYGWDLEDKIVSQPNGFSAFRLSDTTKNQDMWRARWNTELPKDQLLQTADGKTMVLDALGVDLLQRHNVVDDALRNAKNTLNRSQGLPEIPRANWHRPPPDLSTKFVSNLYNDFTGEMVPGHSIIANTQADHDAQLAAMKPVLDKFGLGYVMRTPQEAKNFTNFFEKAQMDFIDPGVGAVAAGKESRGASATYNINHNAFSDSMIALRDGFLDHANNVIRITMKEPIDAANARAQMFRDAGPMKANAFGQAASSFNSIHDIYVQNLLGRSKVGEGSSPIAGFYNWVEGWGDKALGGAAGPLAKAGGIATKAADALQNSKVWNATNAWINRANPWTNSQAAQSDFEALKTALGPHMPFSDLADYVESKGFGANPFKTKQLAGAFNAVGTAAMLRVLEAAQPLIHLSSVLNAAPSVIRSFQYLEGETAEQWAGRKGLNGMSFTLPNGMHIGILDSAKLAKNGVMRTWSPAEAANWDKRVANGYVGQTTALWHQQFGSFDSVPGWKRAIMGDDSITNPVNPKQWLQKHGIIGATSWLNDQSEGMSRTWAHMMGVELAEHLGYGVSGDDAVELFAHKVANEMIANYTPHNRPEIYQGALGTSLGLFQGFMQAYMQRMFRYVETKDNASLMTQLVSQAGIFGMNSLPGWKQFNQFTDDPRSPGSDIQTDMRHRLGIGPADILQNGVLANIPTLFGAPGMAINTRGDANIRGFDQPLDPISRSAALNMLHKMWSAVGTGIQTFHENNSTLTPGLLTEVVSNMIPNRPLAGIFQRAFLNGQQVDPSGQIVSDTQNAMEAAYRMIGVRSERQANDVEAFYANKTQMENKASMDQALRLATRAALVNGNTDAIPVIYQQYIENGGDPRQFNRWVQGNYRDANNTRSSNELIKDLNAMHKDPGKMAMIQRLLDAGVSVSAHERAPDPTAVFGPAQGSPMLNQPSGGLGQYSGQVSNPGLQPTSDPSSYVP